MTAVNSRLTTAPLSTDSGTAAISVRQMDFTFSDDIPLFWYANNPALTMLLTALSGTFPEGERMFMRSVRHFQSAIQNPELRQQVRAFIGQEAHHGKEHDAFNHMMTRKGLPVDYIDRYTKAGLARVETFYSPQRLLAKTCALEHFTALFAETLLANPELIEGMDDRLKPLWIWHAIEESEHKSVAFDVYQDQVGSYWIRSSEMLITTIMFGFFSGLHTIQLLAAVPTQARESTNTSDRPSLKTQLNGLWRQRKTLMQLGKNYLRYYRPSFHPAQQNGSDLQQRGLELLSHYTSS